MTVRVTARVVGALQVAAKLRRSAPAVHQAMVREVTRQVVDLTAYVKAQKLSGQVLNVKTGRLRRSINFKVSSGQGFVLGTVGTNVVYARVHEMGGQTRPHVIEPRNAKALAFLGAGGVTVFARRVNHPGSKFPERSFLRSALADRRATILEGLQNAARAAAREA